MNSDTMRRVVAESPVHGPVLVAELMRLLEEDARRTHEIEVFLRGGPTALDIAEANRENAERDLRAAREKLQIAEQAIEIKQPGFDMYYHQMFAKEMAKRKEAEAHACPHLIHQTSEEARARIAALLSQVRSMTERIYSSEDFSDAVALARPGRLLPLDDEGRLSPQGVTVLVHSICALADRARGAARILEPFGLDSGCLADAARKVVERLVAP